MPLQSIPQVLVVTPAGVAEISVIEAAAHIAALPAVGAGATLQLTGSGWVCFHALPHGALAVTTHEMPAMRVLPYGGHAAEIALFVEMMSYED